MAHTDDIQNEIDEHIEALRNSENTLAEFGYRFPAIFDALKFLLEHVRPPTAPPTKRPDTPEPKLNE